MVGYNLRAERYVLTFGSQRSPIYPNRGLWLIVWYVAFVSLTCWSNLVLAQIPIPDNVKKSVVFLFAYDGETVRVGTGFFIIAKAEPAPTVYLVTAKHLLMANPKAYYPRICMKLNNSKGSAEFIPIDMTGPKAARVFLHPEDPTIDLAVIPASDIRVPVGTAKGYYDFWPLSTSLFTTKEHFEKGFVKEGDDTFFAGWFSRYYGREKNYPIVRFGRLALISDEKIPWRDDTGDQMLHLYLVESQALDGNSGAPVFFRPNPQREPRYFRTDTPTLLLAGVLKGQFGSDTSQNSGIAAVVPAFQLSEILSSASVTAPIRRGKNFGTSSENEMALCRDTEKLVTEILNTRK